MSNDIMIMDAVIDVDNYDVDLRLQQQKEKGKDGNAVYGTPYFFLMFFTKGEKLIKWQFKYTELEEAITDYRRVCEAKGAYDKNRLHGLQQTISERIKGRT